MKFDYIINAVCGMLSLLVAAISFVERGFSWSVIIYICSGAAFFLILLVRYLRNKKKETHY